MLEQNGQKIDVVLFHGPERSFNYCYMFDAQLICLNPFILVLLNWLNLLLIELLKMLVNDVGLEIRAAYGSSKDIGVYASVSIKPDNIYIVGKIPRKQQGQAQSLIEGKSLIKVELKPLMFYCSSIETNSPALRGLSSVWNVN